VRIMIAGGGTGGHVFPGIAIAEAIERQLSGAEVFFMGRRDSFEERVVSRTGRRFVAVPSMGVRRSADLRNAAVPFVVAAGYASSLAALNDARPAVAVGTGGFVSVPPLLAARTLGTPVVLQEQNSYPGLATRLLSRFASEVHVSFDETAAHLPRARTVVVSGNPVRSSFREAERGAARESLGLGAGSRVVFCVGGSRGAHRLNQAVAGAAERLRDLGVELVAQTGSDDEETVASAARAAGLRAVVRAFFDDIAAAYAASDIVVSRAGATAIAELTLVGRPSVLVPYPHATEGHQMKNARALEAAGAAVVVQDSEFTSDALASLARGLIEDVGRLRAMADAARKLARPDAADRVARAILAVATGSPPRLEGAGEDDIP
jgi:UDP-N-acetylglucosamine--N-acetylmuramyl-(pentapeptide) pyrophosphoryl-undecaprenol N-acetylglucosamine transferase